MTRILLVCHGNICRSPMAEFMMKDLHVAEDLPETLAARRDGCVGMAANMIGVARRIIVFDNEGRYMTMIRARRGRTLSARERPRSALFCLRTRRAPARSFSTRSTTAAES